MLFTGGSFPVMGSTAPAHPNVSGATSAFSQAQAWQGTTTEQSRNIPATGTHHSSFPPTQNMSTTPSIHGAQPVAANHMTSVGAPTVTSWSGPSNITQGSQMTQFIGDDSRQRTGSIPSVPTQGGQMTQFTGDASRIRSSGTSEMIPNVVGNAPNGGAMPQPHNQINMANQGGGNFPMGILPPSGGIHMPSTMGPHGGGFGSVPSHPGMVPVPPQEDPSMQQGLDRNSVPTTPTETTQEPG